MITGESIPTDPVEDAVHTSTRRVTAWRVLVGAIAVGLGATIGAVVGIAASYWIIDRFFASHCRDCGLEMLGYIPQMTAGAWLGSALGAGCTARLLRERLLTAAPLRVGFLTAILVLPLAVAAGSVGSSPWLPWLMPFLAGAVAAALVHLERGWRH